MDFPLVAGNSPGMLISDDEGDMDEPGTNGKLYYSSSYLHSSSHHSEHVQSSGLEQAASQDLPEQSRRYREPTVLNTLSYADLGKAALQPIVPGGFDEWTATDGKALSLVTVHCS